MVEAFFGGWRKLKDTRFFKTVSGAVKAIDAKTESDGSHSRNMVTENQERTSRSDKQRAFDALLESGENGMLFSTSEEARRYWAGIPAEERYYTVDQLADLYRKINANASLGPHEANGFARILFELPSLSPAYICAGLSHLKRNKFEIDERFLQEVAVIDLRPPDRDAGESFTDLFSQVADTATETIRRSFFLAVQPDLQQSMQADAFHVYSRRFLSDAP